MRIVLSTSVLVAVMVYAGCELTASEGPWRDCALATSGAPATLAFRLGGTPEASEALTYRASFTDGRCSRSIGVGASAQVGERPDAATFRTATTGTLRVTCSVSEGGMELAKTEATLGLRRDWRYGVTCAAGPVNPYRLCFGCFGYEVQPLATGGEDATVDSLYLVWAGASISNPVHY